MMKSLHIKNYKLFEDLKIPNLGRVNLIAGKNNVGKTALLEALRIYVGEGDPRILSSIVTKRGDVNQFKNREIESLFFNRDKKNTIRINDIKIGYKLVNDYSGKFQVLKEDYGIHTPEILEHFNQLNSNNGHQYDKAIYIPASIDFDNSDLWDKISLTDKEDYVIEALQLVIPELIRINVKATDKRAMMRLKGYTNPIPLKNYGDGSNRVFTIALGMVNASNNILLIDEFETGLHYSLQKVLWEFVFELAKKFNVQVFATTHSWDCIDAFAEIGNEKKNMGCGKFFRFDRKKSDKIFKIKGENRDNDKIIAVEYSQEELQIAVEKRIETR